MQCEHLEFVLESEGLGNLSTEAREHLAECSSCQGLVADFHSIVAIARTLPAEVQPPARVWISLRAQLQAEGLIKEQEPLEALEPFPWWHSLRVLFQPRALASATAALLLLAGTVYFTHKPLGTGQPAANTQPSVRPSQPQQASVAAPASAAPAAPATLAGVVNAPLAKPSRAKDLAPSPSENVASPLTQTERSTPDMQLAGETSVDASFRQNLRTLNQFIAECQRHLKQNPQDEMAREYLNMAYQQKADLLATMMDNGRSEH